MGPEEAAVLHAVIMAGGSGTRFWPLSRRSRPKQLLSLAGGKTLLEATCERIAPLVPPERILVVTGSDTARATAELLPGLPPENILTEPVGRDTAACVGLAATALLAGDPDAVCIVLPADHVIPDGAALRAALAAGAEHVAREGGLLTFGIRPTRPETGFGYLRLGELRCERDGHRIHVLDAFVEKPDAATARRYLASGEYLWNSGMFAWRARDLLDEIARQIPLLAEGLGRIAPALGTPAADRVLAEVYPRLPRTSVDFGIMEGARRRWTIPVGFAWSDVGSWPALADVLPVDGSGSVIRGRVLAVDVADTVIVGEGPVVAAAGVENVVIVATPDAVLVIARDQAQRVKAVVNRLAELGWDDVL